MNARSAAAYTFARPFASVSVFLDRSHVADAAPFALLTTVAALRYAAASSATVGVDAGVADGVDVADGVGVADGVDVGAASGVGDDPGVAAATAVGDGVGTGVPAGVEAPGVPLGATPDRPDDGDNQPPAVTVTKTTTVMRTTT